MRALVVLNSRSGSLAKLGIGRARQQIAARWAANNLDATIVVVPGTGIADRIKSEIAAGREGTRPGFDSESLLLRPPLRYRNRPRALRVMVPEPVPP